MFLVGLLWLEFLGFDTSNIQHSEEELDAINKQLEKVSEKINEYTITKKLLDLKEFPNLTVEQVITEFQENFILE